LNELVTSFEIDEKYKNIFIVLPTLNGGSDVLEKAIKILANTSTAVTQALNELQAIADKLSINFPSLPLSFDLSELRGYHYHTGIVFATFIPEVGREIARGGRYDNIGRFFGRARAATGFSADLRLLVSLCIESTEQPQLVYAPYDDDDASLTEAIRDLRATGVSVVQQLPGHPDEINDLACTGMLEKENQNWVVRPLVLVE
jgi:ATP phosphoribosyltransferase regulatory subunit